MGTRSLTVMVDTAFDEIDREICVLYRQYDGYISGHGHELAKFLSGFEVTNGLRVLPSAVAGKETPKTANGMPCLAAQIIAHFKEFPGQFYLYPATTRHIGEEYVYFVRAGYNQPILIEVQDDDGKKIFAGTPEELLAFQEA